MFSVCVSIFCVLEWSLPSPFIDARGTQGSKHVLRDVLLGRKDPKSLVYSWWRIAIGGVASVLGRYSDVL
jgi:hypothetical protein